MNYIKPPKALVPGSVIDTYLRDSGGEGQDRSVQSQLEEIKAYCKEHQLILRRVYKDVAKSGRRIAGRADFVRMVADYQTKQDNPKGLLIWDYARFGRNAEDANWGIVNIEHENVLIHSIVDDIPEGKYKEIFRSLKHSGNQSQSEANSEAVKRMQHQLVQNTKAMFGTPPRGIMREPLPPVRNERTGEMRTLHKWIPDPTLKDRILRAFKMRLTHKTLDEINAVTGLYKSVACYAGFFRNKIYKGVLEFGGITIENYCEPIIPPAIWDAVNAMNKERKPGAGVLDPRRVRSVFLLSGLAVCQECGAALIGHRIKTWEYYICSKRKLTRREGCHARHIPKSKLENEVFAALREKALSLESLYFLQGRITDEMNRNVKDIERARLELDRDLLASEKEIRNLTNAIKKHGYSESLGKALTIAEGERTHINADMEELKSQIAIPRKTIAQLKDIAAEMDRILTSGTDEEKRTTIRSFVTRIIASQTSAGPMALVYYLPIKIINPDLQGLLGQAVVPPRGLWGEELIEINIQIKATR